jgi:hypothetical protein
VTIVIRRQAGIFAGLAAAAALLTACASGPSQVGNALIVGDSSVSVNQVQQELNTLLTNQPAVQQAQKQGKLDVYSRNLVTTTARHDLVGTVAASNQLTVTDPDVDQFISQQGGPAKLAPELGVTTANVHQTAKDLLLELELARKYADGLSVKAAIFDENSRQAAVTIAQKLAANPKSLAALEKTANAKAPSGQPVALPVQTFTASGYLQQVQSTQQQAAQQGQQAPMVNEGPLFGTPANSVAVFQLNPQNPDWIVALVTARDVNGNTTRPTTGSVADGSDLSTLQQLGVSLMQPAATQAGVRVSPRYGVWDPVGVQVAANQNQAGQVFPVTNTP